MRCPDQSKRDLSRSGAFQQKPLCESQWAALDQHDAVGQGFMGKADLGPAIPDSVGSFRTVLREQPGQTQETDRLDSTNGHTSATLVTKPPDHPGGRSQLRCLGTAQPPIEIIKTSLYGDPIAFRCSFVQICSEAQTQTRGATTQERARLPTLRDVLSNEQTIWQQITVDYWYGQGPTSVEITRDTTILYHNGMPAVPLRWVLIQDPKNKFEPRALLCTDQAATPVQILN
jgi:hypothetical protein